MRLKRASVINFGSYEGLEIDLSNLGLTLVYGSTGSGKSTLQDIPAWILYGATAKGGNVDEVRNWKNPGSVTIGTLVVELPTEKIIVKRIRGGAGKNDLFWQDETGEKIRGKDISETQRFLEEKLGVSEEEFITGSYFHEFSKCGNFFTLKAKDKRELFEAIANLELPAQISERTSEAKKKVKDEIVSSQKNVETLKGRLEEVRSSLPSLEHNCNKWDRESKRKREELELKAKNFEKDTNAKLDELIGKHADWYKHHNGRIQELKESLGSLNATAAMSDCPTCGSKNFKPYPAHEHQKDKVKHRIISMEAEESPYLALAKDVKKSVNSYLDELAEEPQVNPFTSLISKNKESLKHLEETLRARSNVVKSLTKKYNGLDTLYDLSFDLRGQLLNNTVQNAQEATNTLLDKYFEAQIRVEFLIEDSDKLQVNIQKEGHDCVYTQLSKGQRSMLRLCFSVAVMQASANKSGSHFSLLMFDEALDGLDSELKIKAYGLFEELALNHESVLVIDHSPELQALFNSRYHVKLIGESSQVELDE